MQLLNARFQNVSSLPAPSNPAWEGLVRYNTADKTVNYWNGTDWKMFLTGPMVPASIALASGMLLVGNGSNVAAATAKSAIPLSGFGAPTADVSMGGQRLTNLPAPIAANDAANKAYVDGIAQGLNVKNAVRVKGQLPASAIYGVVGDGRNGLTAEANGNINTLGGIDGVTSLVLGDRLLIHDPAESFTNLSDGGIYELMALGSAGAPFVLARVFDADTGDELESAFTFVSEGATAANTGWYQTADNVTLGTTALNWTQFSGAGAITAGKGIVLSGSVAHFYSSGNYTPGDLYFANGATSLAALGIGTANRFLQSSGSAPQWSGYSMPSGTLTTNRLLYASSTTAISQLATANNAILTTNSSGAPSLGTDIPTAVTIGAAYIYRVGGTDVGLLDGGTGASLTAVPGGLVYSAGSALAISAAGTSGHFYRSGGSGAPTSFDLFGSANTWTGVNTATAQWEIEPADSLVSSNGSLADSPYLTLTSKNRTSGGVAREANYSFHAQSVTGTPMTNSLRIRHFSTATSTGRDVIWYSDDGTAMGYANSLTFRGRDIVWDGAQYGTLRWVPTAPRTLTLPDATGTLLVDSSNPARSAVGVARKISFLVQGDGANAFINVAHNLGTRDVTVFTRQANSTDTGTQREVFHSRDVVDANTVRLVFDETVAVGTYYVVTVMG